MSQFPILGQLALGYAPLIDAQRTIKATRLSIVPSRPDARPDAAALLEALQSGCADPGRLLILSVMHEATLVELTRLQLPANMLLEWPAFMLGEAHAEALASAQALGHRLVLRGQSASPLGEAQRKLFKQVVLSLDEARRLSPPELKALSHGLPLLISEARGSADVDEAFQRGAVGVIGWTASGPYEAPAQAPVRQDNQTDLQVIVELMSRLDQGEDVERLEQTLKRDPSLAFKLLRYMNSAAFGLPVEVSSFRHAIMLLGYSRLKRWLALLLATASKDHAMRPIMFAALRRGLLLEELAKSMSEAEVRDEIFICGLFSLLDHMLKQPFSRLLQSIPVPERVRQALVDQTGPYQPYLELVQAIESESAFDVRAAAEKLMLGAEEINTALLQALAKAAQLE